MPDIPPVLVGVDLRMRCNFNKTPWIFDTYAPVEYQLDSALMLFNDDQTDPAFEDAVGILVDGTVYVDDEPYWRNLLVSGATYDIVYLRRPIWQRGLWIWLCDMWHNTPLIDAMDIPQRRPEYTTRQAYARLVKDHAAEMVGRSCTCTGHLYWLYNNRSEKEMTEAKQNGRWVVYERMRLFNPAPVKED